jgi:nucleoside 2-deoxyribosyltransferase
MTIHVVGGVYREYCVHPRWNEIYGSAGRAALAIATLGTPVVLHSYLDQEAHDVLASKGVYLDAFELRPSAVPATVRFRYLHDLATPEISNVPARPFGMLEIREEKVVRFGMLDGDAKVDAEWAVYDPQNVQGGKPFRENGSTAKHLALVLNSWEAAHMAGRPGAPATEVAPILGATQQAEVVIVKMGPQGAYVWTASEQTQVPAYRTSRVWKVGSGDCFVAHFANAWIQERNTPAAAASRASLATAYYCETQDFATPQMLASLQYQPVMPSAAYLAGQVRQVYLAGPFFDLSQVWMVEQARTSLKEMGLQVFSPYHDIGLGTANDVVTKDLEGLNASHVVFAVCDGLDAGTIFEVGHARSRNIPVVVYSERHHEGENLKMMDGTGCVLCKDFTTAIYSVLWEAVKI